MQEKLKLILDTNYFLHFKFLDEIQWEEVLGQKYQSIHALIIPPVVTELDQHKYSDKPKIRERAGKISQRLKKILLSDSPEPLKNGIQVELVTLVGNDVSNSKNIDDQILSYSQFIQANLANDETLIVVTHDMNLQLKLKQSKIKFLDLGDELKLPIEKTKEEKEHEQIKKELLAFQNRSPKLLLSDCSEASIVTFGIKKFVLSSDTDIGAKVDKLKQKYPYEVFNERPLDPSLPFLEQLNGIRKQEWDRYNSELDSFYKEYEEYLKSVDKLGELESRVLKLDLWLLNQGTLPASNVDVQLHITVPKSVELLDEDDYENLMDKMKPQEPSPPLKPRPFGHITDIFDNKHLVPRMFHNHDLINSLHRAEVPNVSSPRITPTNSYNVDIQVKHVKHHSSAGLQDMFLIFPEGEDAASFRVEYRILCDELPNLVKGVVSFLKS